MNDDVNAARERLAKVNAGGLPCDVYGERAASLFGQHWNRPAVVAALVEYDLHTLADEYIRLTAALPAFVRRCVEAGLELPLMRTSDADFEAVRQSGSLAALKVAAQRNVEIIDAAVDRLAAELAGDDQTKRTANND